VYQSDFSGTSFDLAKYQVHPGIAAKYVKGNFGDLFVYFPHFASKTSQRTIDDPTIWPLRT
jgi:hypothetical protein